MKDTVTVCARSSNGCWTCRVRKKKCDESRPSCFSCISFELECHGYGPKPEWMDKGPLQQQQATKIKHIVSQTSRSKKRRWGSNSDAPSLECGSSQTFSSSSSTNRHRNGGGDDPTQHSVFPGIGLIDAACLDEPIWTDLFNNDSFASKPLLGLDSYTELSTMSQSVDHEQPLQLSGSTEIMFDSSSSGSVDLRQNEGMWFHSEFSDEIPTSNEAAWSSASSKDNSSESHSESNTSCRVYSVAQSYSEPLIDGNPGQQTMVLAGLNRWVSGEESEDMFFMHYLDQVFYIQHPFYNAFDQQKRGWLLSILKSVKSAYYASLALSEHHLLSTQFQIIDKPASRSKLRCKDSYYDIAHQEMERSVEASSWWNESIRQVRSMECLACILQLLFLEVIEVNPCLCPFN